MSSLKDLFQPLPKQCVFFQSHQNLRLSSPTKIPNNIVSNLEVKEKPPSLICCRTVIEALVPRAEQAPQQNQFSYVIGIVVGD